MLNEEFIINQIKPNKFELKFRKCLREIESDVSEFWVCGLNNFKNQNKVIN
jgi:hypothetical protein